MEFRKVNPGPLPARTTNYGQKGLAGFYKLLKTNFTTETWMLLGALFQVTAVLVAPFRYAVLPVLFFLGLKIIDTTLSAAGVTQNRYLRNVIGRKYTAQILDQDGNFHGPGREKVAVLLLGAKFNSPLGLFSPGAKELGDYASKMYHELDTKDQKETGFLGYTEWNREDENGAMELISISYWRSAEAVHQYSQSELHLKGLRWWSATAKDLPHLGIMHEVFEAPAGLWESVYLNFQPTLMGRTSFLKKGNKLEGGVVPDEWVSPLFEAKGKLLSSNRRRALGDSAGSEAREYV